LQGAEAASTGAAGQSLPFEASHIGSTQKRSCKNRVELGSDGPDRVGLFRFDTPHPLPSLCRDATSGVEQDTAAFRGPSQLLGELQAGLSFLVSAGLPSAGQVGRKKRSACSEPKRTARPPLLVLSLASVTHSHFPRSCPAYSLAFKVPSQDSASRLELTRCTFCRAHNQATPGYPYPAPHPRPLPARVPGYPGQLQDSGEDLSLQQPQQPQQPQQHGFKWQRRPLQTQACASNNSLLPEAKTECPSCPGGARQGTDRGEPPWPLGCHWRISLPPDSSSTEGCKLPPCTCWDSASVRQCGAVAHRWGRGSHTARVAVQGSAVSCSARVRCSEQRVPHSATVTQGPTLPVVQCPHHSQCCSGSSAPLPGHRSLAWALLQRMHPVPGFPRCGCCRCCWPGLSNRIKKPA